MVKQYEKDTEGQYPSTVIENVHVLKKVKASAKEKNSSERKRTKA
jgi:molybdenum cofactor biosynthesis enzyme